MYNWVEIDLKALEKNYLLIKARLSPGTSIAPVIKNDAYGHGLIPVAKTLVRLSPEAFAVSKFHEAIALRKENISIPIIVLSGLETEEEYLEAKNLKIEPVIYEFTQLEKCKKVARRIGLPFPIHLKIDTGMGRLGFPEKELEKLIKFLKSSKELALKGVMSHFADADDKTSDYPLLQIEKFKSFVTKLKATTGIIPSKLHMANSAATIRFPQAHFDMVRPGILLYGPCSFAKDNFEPVMSFKARIIQVKEVPPNTFIGYGRSFVTKESMKIATISAGYGDGYPRHLSNKGEVLIRNRRCKIVGRVSMNLITVDVSPIKDIQVDDEVVLMGVQGSEIITAEDIAEAIGTINYEIYCRIGANPMRRYINMPEE